MSLRQLPGGRAQERRCQEGGLLCHPQHSLGKSYSRAEAGAQQEPSETNPAVMRAIINLLPRRRCLSLLFTQHFCPKRPRTALPWGQARLTASQAWVLLKEVLPACPWEPWPLVPPVPYLRLCRSFSNCLRRPHSVPGTPGSRERLTENRTRTFLLGRHLFAATAQF